MGESARVRRVRPGVPALPPRPAADGTRGRILRAGLGLFAVHGFHGTSIRGIAAEAAVQSASLYAHFPSKEAILAELVLAGHEEHHARLASPLAQCRLRALAARDVGP
jgi:AcrR family transcriptional regulator